MVPFYQTASFWTTVVAAVAAVLGGIFSSAEVELFTAAAAIVVAYLVQSGIVTQAALKATYTYNEGYRDASEYYIRLTAGEAEEE